MIDKQPIEGGVEILLVAQYAAETGTSSCLKGHKARMYNLPFGIGFISETDVKNYGLFYCVYHFIPLKTIY